MIFKAKDKLNYNLTKIDSTYKFYKEIILQLKDLWWDCDYEVMKNNLDDKYSPDGLPETYVVEHEGVWVGCCSLLRHDTMYVQGAFPWFGNCFVKENFRHCGIMSVMQEFCSVRAKLKGFSKLYLWTTHKGLYDSLGWNYLEDIYVTKDTTAGLYVKNL